MEEKITTIPNSYLIRLGNNFLGILNDIKRRPEEGDMNIKFQQGKLDKVLWKIGNKTPSSLMIFRNKAYSKFQRIRKKRQLSTLNIANGM